MTTLSVPIPTQHPGATAAAAPAARLVDVGVRLGVRWALRNVSLDLTPAASLVVLGANGAGKSTLLRVMATLLRPSTGRCELFGATAGNSAKRRVGFIGHLPMLYADLSARENLEFFARLYNLPDPHQRAADMLDLVELSARDRDPVRSLSRGMIQRVAVGRSLLHTPDLILADEPFAGLDERSTAIVTRCLLDRHRRGAALVLATHDVAAGLEIAARVLVLREGSMALHTPTACTSAQAARSAIGGGT